MSNVTDNFDYSISVQEVVNERQHQLDKGRTPSYDAYVNQEEQLGLAASFLAHPDPNQDVELIDAFRPKGWYPDGWRKLCQKPYEERLKIAAALCLAEMDRLRFIKK